MTPSEYAYAPDDTVLEGPSALPTVWRNISGLNLHPDPIALGWKPVTDAERPTYNPATERLSLTYTVTASTVERNWSVVALTEAELPTLEARKAQLAARVDNLRDAKLTGGYSHNFGTAGTHTLQTRDADDKVNWLTSQAAYSAAVAQGAGSILGATFRSSDNATFTVTYSDGLAALLGMAAWGAAIFGCSWDLKDAIDAAPDNATLDAIDITQGWPS